MYPLRNTLYCIIGLICTLSMTACSSDDHGNGKADMPKYRHTVIVYMSAQNSLGYSQAALLDSAEIASGASRMRSTHDNLILYLDDDKLPRIYRFYKGGDGKGYIQKVKQYSTDLNSSNPSTLRDVLADVKAQYPSRSYGLVMWSHGTGWLPDIISPSGSQSRLSRSYKPMGFGVDVGTGGNWAEDLDAQGHLGQQMEIDDMTQAISESGVRPAYIFFDACLMQCVEVAYSLRNVTDYIVASPATTSGYGAFYYDQIPNGLFCYPYGDDSIKTMVDTYYYNSVDDDRLKDYYGKQGCVMSAIKTSRLDQLATATASALALAKTYTSVNQRDTTWYPEVSDVQPYCDFLHTSYPDMYDIACGMKALLPEADYWQWRTALDQCVVYSRMSDSYYLYSYNGEVYTQACDRANACGVSMFFPRKIYSLYSYYGDLNELIKDTPWYRAVWP